MPKLNKSESIKCVVGIVASYYELRPSDIINKTANRYIINKRQIAQHISYSLITSMTLKEVGQMIGSVGHDTIKYSIRTVNNLRYSDSQYNDDYNYLFDKAKRHLSPLKRSVSVKQNLNNIKNLKQSRSASRRLHNNTILTLG